MGVSKNCSLSLEGPGGDYQAAVEFVHLMNRIWRQTFDRIHVETIAGSALAYVFISLQSTQKTMGPEARLILHPGQLLNVPLNEFFETGGDRRSREFYETCKNFVARNFPSKFADFIAGKDLAISARECLTAGIINKIEEKRLAV